MAGIKASGQLTAAEMERFVRAEMTRRSWPAIVILAFVILPALLWLSFGTGREPEHLPLLSSGIWLSPLFFLAFVVCPLLLFIPRRTVRFQLTSSPTLTRRITYEFDDNGIAAESPLGSSRLTWSSLHAARETKDAFVLYQSSSAYNFVPKRTFESPDDVRRLRELILSKLGPKAKLLKR